MIETTPEVNVQAFDTSGYWFGSRLFYAAQLGDIRYAMDEVFVGRYETGRAPLARFWNPGDDPYGLHKADNAFWPSQFLADTIGCEATSKAFGRSWPN